MLRQTIINLGRFLFPTLNVQIYQLSRNLQQQPVTESYQYSQVSPSRSPSGPTYTQLSGGNNRQSYHTTTAPQANAGK